MPERPPKCRTAEIACTISELHALSPKLAGKRCTGPISKIQTTRDSPMRELPKHCVKCDLDVADDVTDQAKVGMFDFSGLVTLAGRITMLSANKWIGLDSVPSIGLILGHAGNFVPPWKKSHYWKLLQILKGSVLFFGMDGFKLVMKKWKTCKNYNYVVFLILQIFSYWYVLSYYKSNFKKVSVWGLGVTDWTEICTMSE